MKWRRNPYGIAYFIVAGMMLLLGLEGCTNITVRSRERNAACYSPDGEAQLVADYRGQAVLGVLPASMTTETPRGTSVIWYCDRIGGTDGMHYSNDTAVR
jgi:hypothetical protein